MSVLFLAAGTVLAQGDQKIGSRLLSALQWRSIGPAMFSGRVSDVAGVPGNPSIPVYAHSSGGVLRSTSGGTAFDPIFNDGNTLSAGAVKHLGVQGTERFSQIAVNPVRPQVVCASAIGHAFGPNEEGGIFRSTDAGATVFPAGRPPRQPDGSGSWMRSWTSECEVSGDREGDSIGWAPTFPRGV